MYSTSSRCRNPSHHQTPLSPPHCGSPSLTKPFRPSGSDQSQVCGNTPLWGRDGVPDSSSRGSHSCSGLQPPPGNVAPLLDPAFCDVTIDIFLHVLTIVLFSAIPVHKIIVHIAHQGTLLVLIRHVRQHRFEIKCSEPCKRFRIELVVEAGTSTTTCYEEDQMSSLHALSPVHIMVSWTWMIKPQRSIFLQLGKPVLHPNVVFPALHQISSRLARLEERTFNFQKNTWVDNPIRTRWQPRLFRSQVDPHVLLFDRSKGWRYVWDVII